MLSLDPTDIAQLRVLLRTPQLPPEELICLLRILAKIEEEQEQEELS